MRRVSRLLDARHPESGADRQPRGKGRPPKLREEHREHITDALLANWARFARGWPDRVGYVLMQYPDMGGDDEAPSPSVPVDAGAAQDMEAVLVVMRARRPALWTAVRYRYLARWTDQTAARAMKISTEEYRATLLRVYAWVDARLERSALD